MKDIEGDEDKKCLLVAKTWYLKYLGIGEQLTN